MSVDDNGRCTEREASESIQTMESDRIKSKVLQQAREIATLTTLIERERVSHTRDIAASEKNARLAVAMAADHVHKIELNAAILIAEVLSNLLLSSLDYGVSVEDLSKILQNAGLIEPLWYKNNYQDVSESGLDPVSHYILFGAKEQRPPNSRLEELMKSARNPHG